jgi:hypothetical protein
LLTRAPEPSVRNAFLLVALVFCLLFGGMTAAVAGQSGFDIFTLASLLIVVMIMLAVLGALRNPPDD